MKDVSDDDEEDTWMPAPVSKETKSQDRNSRKETQERLRKMMEEDDEEEEAVPSPAPETPAEEVEEEKASEETKEEEPVASTSNGRRRGRRRVMKKRTVKDEDGYLGNTHKFCPPFYAYRTNRDISNETRGSLGIIFGRRACSST